MGIKQLLRECVKERADDKAVIAELKRTVEQYRRLADLSPDCIFIIDQVFGSGIAVTSLDRVSFPDIQMTFHTKWMPLWDNSGTVTSALSISREIEAHHPDTAGTRRTLSEQAADLMSNREVQMLRLIAEGMRTGRSRNAFLSAPRR